MKYRHGFVLAAVVAALAGHAAAAPAGWGHYTDATLGWSIAYPPGWIVDPHYASVSLGPDHEIKGVSFAIAPGVQPGTNLSHNGTGLSVESIAGHDCKPSQFVNPAETVHKLKADGRTYWAASSADAGAGNRYDTELFVVDGTSPCIAVRYFIHYTALENYDPGTIKAFDRARLVADFNRIRATLTLGK